jgi:uncharacterized protein YndB with AHSA1/START domain
MKSPITADPKLDLVLERTIDISPELVWIAWTKPEHLMKWFTPKPWKTVECEIDLRPGGKFYTVMESPEGQRFPNMGCYLEVIPHERLTWTSALQPGFRPAPRIVQPGHECAELMMTAELRLEKHGKGGCQYIATALHLDEGERKRHADMGFHEGWNAALDQLIEHMKAQR